MLCGLASSVSFYLRMVAQELTNPCLIFEDNIKVTGGDLSSDLEAAKSWSVWWDLPLNVDKYQFLTKCTH